MTSLYSFQSQFPDDDACLAHLMKVRYGGTEIDCPKCGAHGKFYRETRDRAYICQHCKHQVFPCAGTFMHRAPDAPDTPALAQVVLRDAPVRHVPQRGCGEGA